MYVCMYVNLQTNKKQTTRKILANPCTFLVPPAFQVLFLCLHTHTLTHTCNVPQFYTALILSVPQRIVRISCQRIIFAFNKQLQQQPAIPTTKARSALRQGCVRYVSMFCHSYYQCLLSRRCCCRGCRLWHDVLKIVSDNRKRQAHSFKRTTTIYTRSQIILILKLNRKVFKFPSCIQFLNDRNLIVNMSGISAAMGFTCINFIQSWLKEKQTETFHMNILCAGKGKSKQKQSPIASGISTSENSQPWILRQKYKRIFQISQQR